LADAVAGLTAWNVMPEFIRQCNNGTLINSFMSALD